MCIFEPFWPQDSKKVIFISVGGKGMLKIALWKKDVFNKCDMFAKNRYMNLKSGMVDVTGMFLLHLFSFFLIFKILDAYRSYIKSSFLFWGLVEVAKCYFDASWQEKHDGVFSFSVSLLDKKLCTINVF